jgi:hypothetical protein
MAASVTPLPSRSEVEAIVLGLIESRALARREAWARERKIEGRELPAVDTIGTVRDPALMHALGIVRRQRKAGAAP